MARRPAASMRRTVASTSRSPSCGCGASSTYARLHGILPARRSRWLEWASSRSSRASDHGSDRAPGPGRPGIPLCTLSVAEIVVLADLDTAVPQDVVRGRDVEEEIGQREMQQVVDARKLDGAGFHLQRDRAFFRAVDLRRCEFLQVGIRLLNTGDQFVERQLDVVVLRNVDAGEAGGAA